MIAYDLECENGHTFEGWFDNEKEFKKQCQKGLVSCPVCNSTLVTRALSTFGIARHRHQDGGQARVRDPLVQFSKFVQENFEDVGVDFAKEALKIHYGATESRNIRGVSTVQEEETLRSEGVSFFKLPVFSKDKSGEDD
jgi:hypothetical protein